MMRCSHILVVGCFILFGYAEALVSRRIVNSITSSTPQWVYCAAQWQDCHCPGAVRWGARSTWFSAANASGGLVQCSIQHLPDVLPGSTEKHCECQISLATAHAQAVNPGVFPSSDGALQPDISCTSIAKDSGVAAGPWAKELLSATRSLCTSKETHTKVPVQQGPPPLEAHELQGLLDAWIDPRFRENHARVYSGQNGWCDEAFVNYVGGAAPGTKWAKMTEVLIRSVHMFSQKPIIVFNFGFNVPLDWTPERFPRLVLMHMRPLPPDAQRSFNWNKFRSMLVAKVKTGVELDSDMFVAPRVDALFAVTRREVTKDYPMPILPAHFLDWSPRDGGKEAPKYWSTVCTGKHDESCPGQTLRWGQAHPTWTFWALPFVGRWLSRQMLSEPVLSTNSSNVVLASEVPEDEDLLNVATWVEHGTKQWCKFDIEGPDMFVSLLRNFTAGDVSPDRRFYPDGAAHVFYTAHHAVNPQESEKFLSALAEAVQNRSLPPPIEYKGAYYSNGDELRRSHPNLKCII